MNVLMIGVDETSIGGMLTVVNNYKDNKEFCKMTNLKYVATVIRSNKFVKIKTFLCKIPEIISTIRNDKIDIVHVHMAERGSVFTPNVWFVGMGSLAASVVTFICTYILSKKLVPELVFNKDFFSVSKLKNLVGNGIWNSLNSLGNELNSGLDLIISNLFLNGVATGQIAVVKTIGTMFSMLYEVVYQPFQPNLIKAYASGDVNIFINEQKKAMRICGYFSNVAFAGFVALGGLYYKLWLPSEDTKLLHMLTIVTVLGSVTAGVMRPIYYVYTLTLKNKLPCWITIAGGFLNVVSMYVLLKYTQMGVYAIVSTTTVIMLCINLFFNPVYAAYNLKISVKVYYKVIFKHLISAAIMVGGFIGIARVIRPSSWIGLIVSAIIMCISGLIIHVLIMCNMDEKLFLIKKITKRK